MGNSACCAQCAVEWPTRSSKVRKIQLSNEASDDDDGGVDTANKQPSDNNHTAGRSLRASGSLRLPGTADLASTPTGGRQKTTGNSTSTVQGQPHQLNSGGQRGGGGQSPRSFTNEPPIVPSPLPVYGSSSHGKLMSSSANRFDSPGSRRYSTPTATPQHYHPPSADDSDDDDDYELPDEQPQEQAQAVGVMGMMDGGGDLFGQSRPHVAGNNKGHGNNDNNKNAHSYIKQNTLASSFDADDSPGRLAASPPSQRMPVASTSTPVVGGTTPQRPGSARPQPHHPHYQAAANRTPPSRGVVATKRRHYDDDGSDDEIDEDDDDFEPPQEDAPAHVHMH